jgi:hypothetical protein
VSRWGVKVRVRRQMPGIIRQGQCIACVWLTGSGVLDMASGGQDNGMDHARSTKAIVCIAWLDWVWTAYLIIPRHCLYFLCSVHCRFVFCPHPSVACPSVESRAGLYPLEASFLSRSLSYAVLVGDRY